MPLYDYECRSCGVMEVVHPYPLLPLTRCPECKTKRFKQVFFRVPGMFIPNTHWESENKGRGRYIGQLADKINDPKAYCRSRDEIREKAKRAGFTKIENA